MVQSIGKIVVAAAALNVAATMALPSNVASNDVALEARNEFELEARDYDGFELEARDYDDFELEARDFDEFDLEAREPGLRGKMKGMFKGFRGKKPSPPASPAPSEGGEAPGRREFDDEFELEARDFDDFDLEARDYDDFDLEAREPGFRGKMKGMFKGFRGKKPSPPASPAPSEGGEAPGRRAFDDEFELEARDFDDFELEAREPGFRGKMKGMFKGFRGKKPSPPASPAPSEGGEAPGRRAFDDEFELEARDFDDFELEARDPKGGFRGKLKGMFKGFRGKKPSGPPPSSPAPSGGEGGEAPSRREFDDFELEARDPKNGLIRGKMRGMFKGFRGKKPSGPPPSAPAPSGGEGGDAPSRRDFDEFELEARGPGFRGKFKGMFKGGFRGKKPSGPPPSAPSGGEGGDAPGRRSYELDLLD